MAGPSLRSSSSRISCFRHGRGVPGRLGQTLFDGQGRVFARKAVVATSDHVHASDGGLRSR